MSKLVNNFIVNLDGVKKIYEEVEKTGDLTIFDTMLERIKKEDGPEEESDQLYRMVIATAKSNYIMGVHAHKKDRTTSMVFEETVNETLKNPDKCALSSLLVVLFEVQFEINVCFNPLAKRRMMSPIAMVMGL